MKPIRVTFFALLLVVAGYFAVPASAQPDLTSALTRFFNDIRAGYLTIPPKSSDPTGATQGAVYYSSVTNGLKTYDGATWNGVGASFPLNGASAAGCTAAAIPYSFTGDTNTGLSTTAADSIALCVAGFSALTIDASQATMGMSYFKLGTVTFSGLGSPSNGVIAYCSDCTVAATCAGSGTGALAKRINSAWVCN